CGQEFTTGSSKPVSLTVDPNLTYVNRSDDSADCAKSLSVSVPKVYFVEKFETITIKPNEMIKNFMTKFVKTDVGVNNKGVLKPSASHLKENVNKAHSTITIETGSKLNPNCEPYVPSGSLEQVSTSSSLGLRDCDVKLYDPKEFFQKGKNQKVTPKAKPVSKPFKTNQSSKPKVKPQRKTHNHHTARKNEKAKQNQNGFHKQKKTRFFHFEVKSNLKSKPPVKPIDSCNVNKPINVNTPKSKGKESSKVPKVPKSIKI
ncbi:hypothetical protein R6Q57_020638, partial [Mikania cordata]